MSTHECTNDNEFSLLDQLATGAIATSFDCTRSPQWGYIKGKIESSVLSSEVHVRGTCQSYFQDQRWKDH